MAVTYAFKSRLTSSNEAARRSASPYPRSLARLVLMYYANVNKKAIAE
jgi:hypothetical protein